MLKNREQRGGKCYGVKKQLELLLFNIVMHLNFADKYCVKWNLRERSFGTSWSFLRFCLLNSFSNRVFWSYQG